MKLTPKIHKALEELAKSLPPVHRVTPDGEFMMVKKSKSLLWEELTEEQRKTVKEEPDQPIYKNKVEKSKGNVLFYRKSRYIMSWREPIRVNHLVLLTIEFKKGGMEAVEKYAKYVNEMTIKSLEQQRINAKRNEIQREQNIEAGAAESVAERLKHTQELGS